MKPLPEIATARTLIRVLDPDDTPLLLAYETENMAHLAPWEPARSSAYYLEAAIRQRLAHTVAASHAGGALHFAALDRASGRMLASINFTQITRGVVQSCQMGCSVALAVQGQGLMHEVGGAAIAYLFDTLELHRVQASHQPTNLRSEAMLRRLGFEREGLARSYLKINGKWEDMVLTSLINPKQ